MTQSKKRPLARTKAELIRTIVSVCTLLVSMTTLIYLLLNGRAR